MKTLHLLGGKNVLTEGAQYTINQDGYELTEVKSSTETIEWLNEILQCIDLYEQIINKKNIISTDEIIKLKGQIEKGKDKIAIKKLNRLLIELAYPQETPKKPKSNNEILAGTIFGPYSFFVIQNRYYPNSELCIWNLRELNNFEFNVKSKMMFEVKLFDKENENKGNSGAIIRLRLKSRGYHFLLMNEFINNNQLEFSKDDKIYIGSGWEDIIIVLLNKSFNGIHKIQKALFEHKYTDRIQTFFIREICNLGQENIGGEVTDSNIKFISTIKLKHISLKGGEAEEFKSAFNNLFSNKTGVCPILYNYYGTLDYIIEWENVTSLRVMDDIIIKIQQNENILKYLDDIQTVIWEKNNNKVIQTNR